jgi:hypothetical protein
MGIFNVGQTQKQDPEIIYLRALSRIQKQLGNIPQKKLSLIESQIINGAEKYHYPKWQAAELLSQILHTGIISNWQDCFDFALKTAKTLGRSSCLSLDKNEFKKVILRFNQ